MSKLKKDKDYLIHYWHYLSRHKLLLGVGFVLVPFIAFFHIVQPYIIKLAIDNYIIPGDLGGLYLMVILFIAAVLLDFGAKTFQMYLFQYIGQKTVMDIRKDLFIHVISYCPAYFDKTPIGIVISRLTSDIESLNESFSSGLVTLIADVLTLLGIVVMMSFLSFKLTLITLLILPPMAVLVNFFRIKLRYYFDIIRSTIGKMNGYIQEQLQGISVLQLFMQELNSFTRFKHLNHRYYQSTISSVTYDALLYSLIDMINVIVISVMIWYGFGQYQMDYITIGVFVAFIEYIHRFFMPLKEISNKFAVLQHALAALEKIFGTFELKDSLQAGFEDLIDEEPTIMFENVSFAYRGYEDKLILDDISFKVQPGQVFALVGPTGSGKTSILRLLGRLYDGYSGLITYGGVDISDLKLDSIRSKISIVTQDIILFSDSIRFNICMGDDLITEERLLWAAKTVQIHDFIMSLPNQYDTVLDKGAKSLSTGQAQLISFARALASFSPILLLDEATSSVDSFSEKAIQQGLLSLFKHKTTLVVAHRLSTIKHADQILVLNKGQIIEKGNHSDLMQQDGFYAKLFNMQFASL